jgi:hypothetical protein
LRRFIKSKKRKAFVQNENKETLPMYSMTAEVLFVHSLTLYAANLATIGLVWMLWRRTHLSGFILVASGGALHVMAGMIQNAIAPFPIGNMPFSGIRTLDDLTRSKSFLTLYCTNIASSLLILIGAVMVIRAWRNTARSEP